MTASKKLKIFLSYAHADVDPVRELYQSLIEQDFEVWFDEESLIAGQEWKSEIERALETSDVVLVCLSEHAISKEGFIQREFRFALDKALEMTEGGIFLIPVRLTNCKVPAKLSRYHWVDLFAENGRSRLMRALSIRSSQIINRVEYSNSPVAQPPLQTGISSSPPLTASKPLPKPTGNPSASTGPKASPQKENLPSLFWQRISTWFADPAAFFGLWVAAYLPAIPAFILFLSLIASSSSTTSPEFGILIALASVVLSSVIQWLLLRLRIEKAFRWVFFNLLIALYIFASHGLIQYVTKGFNEWISAKDIPYNFEVFWKLDFVLVIFLWTVVNLSFGVWISRNNIKKETFFSNPEMGMSFWNKWEGALLAGIFISFAILALIVNISPSLNLTGQFIFGVIGGLCGLTQWLISKKRQGWGWILINLVFGLVMGWATEKEVKNYGAFIDNFVLAIWFMLNTLIAPVVLQRTKSKQVLA